MRAAVAVEGRGLVWVCFTVSSHTSSRLHDTIKLIRRRMSSKQWRSVLMCLFLVETLVKNCSVVVHRSIGTEKFMKAVMAVVSATKGKINADAREVHTKALELIQAWGEAFLPKQVGDMCESWRVVRQVCNSLMLPPQRDPGLRWFVIAYQQLRQKGVKFPRPQMDTTAAPIFTPPPHIPEDTEPEHKAAAANSTGAHPRAGAGSGACMVCMSRHFSERACLGVLRD